MYETQLTIVGTLITPVGKRRLLDGTTVTSFRVASNERRFDRANESWSNGDTLYTSVTAWRRLGDHVHASFVVGDPIMVRGRLFSRSYDDKDGRRHSVIELEASAVGPDLSRCTAVVTRMRRNDPAVNPPTANDGEIGGDSRPAVESDDPWDSGASEREGRGAGDGDGPGHGRGGDDAGDGVAGPERRVAVEAAVGG